MILCEIWYNKNSNKLIMTSPFGKGGFSMRRILSSIVLGWAGSMGIIITQCITHSVPNWTYTAIIAGGMAFIVAFGGYTMGKRDTELKNKKEAPKN